MARRGPPGSPRVAAPHPSKEILVAAERMLVFIPMYNCERQIPRVLARFGEALQRRFAEIIVVDNGSRDNGVEAAVTGLSKLVHLPGKVLVNDDNYNLGGSHKVAFEYALAHGFDQVVVLHGDDQADINDLVPHLDEGAYRAQDSLLGSRFMRGSRLQGYSHVRTLGNHVFNLLFSAAARHRVHDLGSGLNLYSARYLEPRFYLGFPDSLTFNIHMLLAGIHRRSRFGFFPLSWREEDQVSNVRMMRQSLQTGRIALEFARSPEAFLAKDWSSQPGRPYTSTVVAQVSGGHVDRTRAPAFPTR
ncbi:glycosyltransferase family 2 protein [Myxococcus sp. CA033]|nr:glycosyltransferase family 2 protein [Myxococcus sp. CA033]NTX56072.1 glycosyltransferase family 2 protein [Myxococcus sp. CA039A]